MKMLASITVLAAAITLGGAAVEQWMDTNKAQAQGSSACYQNCTNVRRWPSAQCREYCRGKAKRATSGPSKSRQ
jgi:hypothetical protein